MVRQAHHEVQALKSLGLILSLSKDEAQIQAFSAACQAGATPPRRAFRKQIDGETSCPSRSRLRAKSFPS
jgi:hypothetical protein